MHDKIALVTGAAGGIGAAVARALAAAGATTALVDRDEPRLAALAADLIASGARALALPADVAGAGRAEAVIGQAERELGPLDYLVNAAGVLRHGGVADLSDEDWDATFAVNATGVFRMSRAAAARMTARRGGAIVTIASNAARTARTGMAAYAASKAAATAFTKCLGLEVAPYGVRCNVVAPGSTDTPMLTSLWDGPDDERGWIEGVPGEFRAGIPLGRIARPGHIADAVLFLLSDQAAHITMQDLTVDGGATLGA
jgi:2,3-dihydro-2,3-dihydroxybenzoate dehydrogenase